MKSSPIAKKVLWPNFSDRVVADAKNVIKQHIPKAIKRLQPWARLPESRKAVALVYAHFIILSRQSDRKKVLDRYRKKAGLQQRAKQDPISIVSCRYVFFSKDRDKARLRRSRFAQAVRHFITQGVLPSQLPKKGSINGWAAAYRTRSGGATRTKSPVSSVAAKRLVEEILGKRHLAPGEKVRVTFRRQKSEAAPLKVISVSPKENYKSSVKIHGATAVHYGRSRDGRAE